MNKNIVNLPQNGILIYPYLQMISWNGLDSDSFSRCVNL